MKSIWNIKKPKDRKDMNWAEAKWANPRLRPNSDYDRDGVKNQFDCKPFDRKRQHSPKYYMMYSNEDEHGLVKGKDEAMSAKKILKSGGKKGVGYYEYDYEE